MPYKSDDQIKDKVKQQIHLLTVATYFKTHKDKAHKEPKDDNHAVIK